MRAADTLKSYGLIQGLRENEVQQQYATHIEQGIELAMKHGSGQLFAEAETGTGKTIGYLVAAGLACVTHQARAIVSTFTLALQRQMIQTDEHGEVVGGDVLTALNLIEQATGRRLKAALRIGRRNFTDPKRVEGVVQRLQRASTRPSEDDEVALDQLLQWARDNPGHEAREFLEAFGYDCLPCNLSIDDLCITGDTDQESAAWAYYAEHTHRSKDADIVVTNHAMLLANAMYGRSALLTHLDDERRLCAIVVDECDRMEDAARMATSDIVSLRNIQREVAAIDPQADQSDSLSQAIEALIEVFNDVHDTHADQHTRADGEMVMFWDELRPSEQSSLCTCLQVIGVRGRQTFQRLGEGAKDAQADLLRSVEEQVRALFGMLDVVQGQGGRTDPKTGVAQEDYVALRWSPQRAYPSFRRFRLYPARAIKPLWSIPRPEEATSDTSGDAELDAKRLRREALREQRERLRAHALVLTSATIRSPGRENKNHFIAMEQAFGIYAKENPCAGMNASGASFAPKRFGQVSFVFSAPNAPDVYLDKAQDVLADDADWTAQEQDLRAEYNPAWIEYNVRAVQAAQAQGGRILVLTNAYASSAAIAQALRETGLTVIEKRREIGMEICRDMLVDDPNGILVAPSAWEGFDLGLRFGPDGRQAKIKHVIVTQVPFQAPDGALSKAVLRYLTARVGKASKARSILFGSLRDKAARKFRQAFGRGIRGTDDAFTFWMTDPRFPRSKLARRHYALNDPTAGSRNFDVFRDVLPERFLRHPEGSRWDVGSVLDPSGRLVTFSELAEEVFI